MAPISSIKHHCFIAAGALLVAHAWGCSLIQPDADDCVDDAACELAFGRGSVCQTDGRCGEAPTCTGDDDCQALFGFGSLCGADTLCSQTQLHPRCTRSVPEDLLERPEEYRDRLLIGALFSYTSHLDTAMAAELAITQANTEGGLDDRLFAMVTCDYTDGAGDELDSIEATQATTRYLVETLRVPVIVGPRGSDRTQAAFEATDETPAVIISPSATSPFLTDLDGSVHSDASPGLLWRTVASDRVQAEAIAADMNARGVQNVAVVFEEGLYGNGLAPLFTAAFEGGGGADVSTEMFSFIGGGFLSSVAEVGSEDFDEVLFISSDIERITGFFNAATANASLVDQYLQKGLFLPDSGAGEGLIEGVSAQGRRLFPNLRGTRPASTIGEPLYNFFSAAYEQAFPDSDAESGAFNAHGYDAAWLAMYGIVWSALNEDQIHPEGIARGLRRVSSGPDRNVGPPTWSAVVEAFRAGDTFDVQGVSGALDYDSVTEETTTVIEIWLVVEDEDDGFVIVAE